MTDLVHRRSDVRGPAYRDVVDCGRRIGRHAGSVRPITNWGWIGGLLLGGVLAVLLGVGGVVSVQGLSDNGVRASAEVVEVTSAGRSGYNYTLRYALEDGTVVSCETGDVLGRPTLGDTVRVLYDRQAPDMNCQSADYGTDMALPIIFIVGGAVMLVVAGVGNIRSR